MECSKFVCTSSSKKHGLPGRKNLYGRCYEMENLILHYQTIPIYYTIYLLCLLETLLYVVSGRLKGTCVVSFITSLHISVIIKAPMPNKTNTVVNIVTVLQ